VRTSSDSAGENEQSIFHECPILSANVAQAASLRTFPAPNTQLTALKRRVRTGCVNMKLTLLKYREPNILTFNLRQASSLSDYFLPGFNSLYEHLTTYP
jgi:hypothetical protein